MRIYIYIYVYVYIYILYTYTGGILRWKVDFAEMEIAAEMDNQVCTCL
jgi:hypothetical protein